MRTIAGGALPGPLPQGLACLVAEGGLGTMLLAASPVGLVRLAFDDHGDADELRARAAARRGSQAAREHLDRAAHELQSSLLGHTTEIGCRLDWTALAVANPEALAATTAIPYGEHCSYTALGSERSAYEMGLTMGAHPTPIVAPCHRVTRGVESPQVFVAGSSAGAGSTHTSASTPPEQAQAAPRHRLRADHAAQATARMPSVASSRSGSVEHSTRTVARCKRAPPGP